MADEKGDLVYKNALIAKFATDVVDAAVDKVEKDRGDVSSVAGNPAITSVSSSDTASLPFVNKDDLRVRPADFSNLSGSDAGGNLHKNSTVMSRSGLMNAAALADLFIIYGRNLTAIKTCSFRINKITTSNSATSTVTPVTVPCTPQMDAYGLCSFPGSYTYNAYTSVPANSSSAATVFSWPAQITALSSRYAMTPSEFMTKIRAGVDPFDNMKVGDVYAPAAMDDLIAKIKTVVEANMSDNVGTINITTCHSSCHSSCHGSRGRR
jgi:hypothetical protein